MSVSRLVGGVVAGLLACVLVAGILGAIRGGDFVTSARGGVPAAAVVGLVTGVVASLQKRDRL